MGQVRSPYMFDGLMPIQIALDLMRTRSPMWDAILEDKLIGRKDLLYCLNLPPWLSKSYLGNHSALPWHCCQEACPFCFSNSGSILKRSHEPTGNGGL
jgi:hypothetical protein